MSAFAVFILIIISNLVGCSTGTQRVLAITARLDERQYARLTADALNLLDRTKEARALREKHGLTPEGPNAF